MESTKRKGSASLRPGPSKRVRTEDLFSVLAFFLRLPSVVQYKILREFFTCWEKAFLLSTLPELEPLLRSGHAWLHPTPDHRELYACLQTVRAGLYLSRSRMDAFVVTTRSDGLSFACVRLEYWDWETSPFAWETFHFHEPVGRVVDFLKFFTSQYRHVDPTEAVYATRDHYFTIHRSSRRVFFREDVQPLREQMVLADEFYADTSREVLQVLRCMKQHLEEDDIFCFVCPRIDLRPVRLERLHESAEEKARFLLDVGLAEDGSLAYLKAARPSNRIYYPQFGNFFPKLETFNG